MAKSVSFAGFFIVFLVVSAAVVVMMPQAEARRQCSELLETGGACQPGKCGKACTSKHGNEANGRCVHDESGSGVSCQCHWFC